MYDSQTKECLVTQQDMFSKDDTKKWQSSSKFLNAICKSEIVELVKDWFAPETMTEFFRQYYSQMETFDKEGMKDLLYNPKEICFEDASQKFRLIEDGGVSVIVNTGENMALVEQLKTEWMSYALMKQLSQYSVTIHKGDFEKLKRFGAVEEIIESIFVVNDRAQYDECIGLRLDNHWLSETLII